MTASFFTIIGFLYFMAGIHTACRYAREFGLSTGSVVCIAIFWPVFTVLEEMYTDHTQETKGDDLCY